MKFDFYAAAITGKADKTHIDALVQGANADFNGLDISDIVARLQIITGIAALDENIRSYAVSGARRHHDGYKSLVHPKEKGDTSLYTQQVILPALDQLRQIGLHSTHPDLSFFPPGSWSLQFEFTLAKPWISKDDTPFYVTESVNPVRKEKVFKAPMMAASSWKGALRWTLMHTRLASQRDTLTPEQFATERLAQTLLFGPEQGGKPNQNTGFAAYLDALHTDEARKTYERMLRTYFGVAENQPLPHHRGRLLFYPTFFNQMDVEVFGEKDPAVDAEIVEMADYLLQALGVIDRQILVNSVGCRKCRPSYLKELRAEAEKNRATLCPDCQRKITTNPLRIFDCKVETCREVSRSFSPITDFICQECEEHFLRFRSYLDFFQISYAVEPRLVRGIDYYTKTTFEFISSRLGAQDAILGGGRYDDMMKEFGGPDMCGIGFAVGMERLVSLVSYTEKSENFLYVVFLGEEARKKGMDLARYLRRQGIESLMEYKDRSIKNQFSRANKLGARWVLTIGEEEIRKGRYQLKNMATGLQQEVGQDEIVRIIQGSLDAPSKGEGDES